MSTDQDCVPVGRSGLIPHLICQDCAGAIEFYKHAFGAVEKFRMAMPGESRLIHAELEIGGFPVYLNDDFPEMCGGKCLSPTALGGTPVTIHRYVPDCDAAVEQAVQAGAKVQMPPADMFWGDRYAQVIDPYGHSWSLATPKRSMSPEEMMEALKADMAAMGAPPSA